MAFDVTEGSIFIAEYRAASMHHFAAGRVLARGPDSRRDHERTRRAVAMHAPRGAGYRIPNNPSVSGVSDPDFHADLGRTVRKLHPGPRLDARSRHPHLGKEPALYQVRQAEFAR